MPKLKALGLRLMFCDRRNKHKRRDKAICNQKKPRVHNIIGSLQFKMVSRPTQGQI